MIEEKYIELEDECLGPDKKAGGKWEIFLFIKNVKKFKVKKRNSRTDFVRFIRKSKGIVTFVGPTKKDVLRQVEDFCNRKDVRPNWLV